MTDARCCVLLLLATDVEGIFRLSGSAKRINQLQELFDSPDRYGKGLDWTGYTVHDAANIFRRYLIQLPEPIVPLDFYERFRDPLRHLKATATATATAAPAAPAAATPAAPADGGEEGESTEKPPFDRDNTVATFQQLIKELPALNRQLLLYILDLMTVFAAKADVNRMTAANLSTIFQPGLLSHPDHNMSPEDYKLSQDVLVFLIENQDNFVFGMTGTAADEQTVKDVQSGAQPGISNLRRSASNASGGADSLRRYQAALRRNASVSSNHSKSSGGNTATPTTPSAARSPSTLGVHRSNTVPPKRPSGLSPSVEHNRDTSSQSQSPSGRLHAHRHSMQTSRSPSRTPPRTPSFATARGSEPSGSRSSHDLDPDPANAAASNPSDPATQSEIKNTSGDGDNAAQQATASSTSKSAAATPSKERKFSTLLGLTSPDDGRQPNRLKKKKRVPDSRSGSAQSSTLSLQTGSEDATLGTSHTSQPLTAKDNIDNNNNSGDQSHPSTPRAADPTSEQEKEKDKDKSGHLHPTSEANSSSKEEKTDKSRKKGSRSRSRPSSPKSRSSFSDVSDDPHKTDDKDKRRSWRLPRSLNRSRDQTPVSISSNARAEVSHSSFGNTPALSQENTSTSEPHRSNKDLAGSGRGNNTQTLAAQDSDLSSVSQPATTASASASATSPKENSDGEKKGFFGKFKAKVAQVKEGVKEKEKDREGDKEKERAKSPPSSEGDNKSSSHHNNKAARGGGTSDNTEGRRSGEGQEQHHQHPPSSSASPPHATAATTTPTTTTTTATTTVEETTTAETTGTTAAASGPTEPPATALTTVQEEAPPSPPPPATSDTASKTPAAVPEVPSAPHSDPHSAPALPGVANDTDTDPATTSKQEAAATT